MADNPKQTTADFEERLARIQRMNVETQKFVEEGMKLAAEARTADCEHSFSPVMVALAGAAAGAAIPAAVVALVKLLGH